MKVASCVAVLFAVCGNAHASLKPFGLTKHHAPAGAEATAAAVRSTATDVALNLRGGAASSKAELAMKGFQVLMGAHGIISERAACKTPSLLYNGIFGDLKENSVAEFAMESVGTTSIGLVLMSILSIYTDLSVAQIVAAGSVMCFALGLKWQLQGKFDAAGFVDGMGLVYLASFFPLYPILKGMGDTNLWLKIFIAFPFLNGMMGWITGKNSALKDPNLTDDADIQVSAWNNSMLMVWGVFAYNIIEGKDAYEAMKYAMALFLVHFVDMNFIRKQNKIFETNVEPKIFMAIHAALTYLFWAE